MTAEYASRYNKIRNVHTYLELGLPVADLFVLDDPLILDSLLLGTPVQALVDDLAALVPRSLVIRTDIATDDTLKRQLLPRTNEVRDVDPALDFMRRTLQALRNGGVTERVAFILHNFIPATAAAFAYAAPGQRKVRIEALWGLPEGLYYNSHDKIEVDTGSKDLSAIKPHRLGVFRITKRPRFKRYFVAPDSDGNWVTKQVAEPWDWRLSIQKEAWIRAVAWYSRRIAETERRSVSIMWFIGVAPWASKQPIFPWYHESFDYERMPRVYASRRKTPFDQSHVIRTRADIDFLRREAAAAHTRVRQIRIQPREDELLRDRQLLKTIGELARKINAVILLEGGTLSHAYYQLVQTKAVVEVANPFDLPEETQDFNKLVRDLIPTRIMQGGEVIRVRRLTGDPLLRALREKLVEEAFEALDASHHDTIMEELADIEEVIDAVLKQLKSRRRQLHVRQAEKRSRVGGFKGGYVLLDTSNPPPVDPGAGEGLLPLPHDTADASDDIIFPLAISLQPPILAKWGDRRDHVSASERLLNLVVSLVHEPWSADSREIALGTDADAVARARVRGKRIGATLHLEVSLFIPPQQLSLLK
ncbi:MAG: nucleoside triphosphate pyrophosphohydrolase [Candidatus Rokuibacteriota bacterium]